RPGRKGRCQGPPRREHQNYCGTNAGQDWFSQGKLAASWLLQLRPVGESIFAREHKLRIAQAKHCRLACGIVRGLEFRMTPANPVECLGGVIEEKKSTASRVSFCYHSLLRLSSASLPTNVRHDFKPTLRFVRSHQFAIIREQYLC